MTAEMAIVMIVFLSMGSLLSGTTSPTEPTLAPATEYGLNVNITIARRIKDDPAGAEAALATWGV